MQVEEEKQGLSGQDIFLVSQDGERRPDVLDEVVLLPLLVLPVATSLRQQHFPGVRLRTEVEQPERTEAGDKESCRDDFPRV